MTTARTITEAQIRGLRREALTAEDFDQAAICDLAIEGEIDTDDYTTLSRRGIARLNAMDQDDAIEECARVIRDAQAQG